MEQFKSIETTELVKIANAIRAKTGSTEKISLADMPECIKNIGGGSGGGDNSGVVAKDIRFMDYDGTLLYSYSVDEFATMTELPPLPEQKGLICQGWNWSLEDIKAMGRAVDVGATYITDDGKTRLYIHLKEGRTAPMVGVCPNGTVTVDWGDGSEPDVLTGTMVNRVKWTPNHEYGEAGDYVISLTVDGEMGFSGGGTTNAYACILRHSSSNNGDGRNRVYQNSLQKVEIGNGVTSIGTDAFQSCCSMSSITIPEGVTRIWSNAFQRCYSLSSITLPDGTTSIESNAFQHCYGLSSITIPYGVTSIGSSAFENCYSLTSVTLPYGVTSIGYFVFRYCYSLSSITIPDSVTSIGSSAFSSCYSINSVTIPSGVTSIDSNAFSGCYGLSSIAIPDGVTSIGNYAFNGCYSLSSVTIPHGVTSIGSSVFNDCNSLSAIAIPDSVTSIGSYAFYKCYGVKFYDFTTHTAVPTLSGTNAFTGIPADCEIRVPAALYDEWIAATNWATYAANIVAV